jgi:hypothetical protein
LADVLDRVLDKGVVVIGDIGVSILDIELLTLRVRLLIASANTAREMGVDWWTSDPYYSSDARRAQDEIEAAAMATSRPMARRLRHPDSGREAVLPDGIAYSRARRRRRAVGAVPLRLWHRGQFH